MKTEKRNKLMWLLLALVLTLTACDGLGGNGKDDTKALTPEQSKDQLDESMTSMANDLDGLSTLKSIDVTASMMNMDMVAPSFEDLVQPVSEVKGTSLDEMEEAMENGVLALSLSDQTKWGTYDYNFTTKAFDFTEGAVGTYIMNAPSSDAMTSNDMEVKLVVAFQDVDFSKIITTTNEEEIYTPGIGYEYIENTDTFHLTVLEVFTDVNFTIKQNNDLLIGYGLSLDLDADDTPQKATTSLLIEDYKIETTFDASDRSNKVSQTTSFTKADNEMIGYNISFNGDLSDERINQLNEEMQQIDATNEMPSDEFLSSLDYNMEVELRFGDFIITGLADAGKLYDSYAEYTDPQSFDNSNLDDMQYAADALNNAMTLILKKKDGSLVGSAEVFVFEDNQNDWESTESYYYLEPRFKFADGTYISPEDDDPEGELEQIFADFINAIDDFASKMEEAGNKLDINM